ncbi:hypothetical protein [Pandoraea horticolens]|uniref:hypothetical protein n=1 Tax=Pandoraea horticolens TaxID=2508298 RepID=UPI00123FA494|nr:hypothetical protein [Pandoraea horticolens]
MARPRSRCANRRGVARDRADRRERFACGETKPRRAVLPAGLFNVRDLSAHPVSEGGRWWLVLELAHNVQANWRVPMPGRSLAQRWTKIFRLANAHRL